MLLSSLQKGLVFHAPLSEERYNQATKRVDDLTPYENHGTADAANLGVFVADRMGQLGRAMSFNGASDKVVFPQTTISKDAGAFTICFKTSADFTSNYNNNGQILSKNSYGYQYLGLMGDGSSPYDLAGELDVNGSFFVFVENIIPVGVWNCIVVSFDLGRSKTYLNGLLIHNVSISHDLTLKQFSGGLQGSQNSWFNGSIADGRIYNRALSQEEVTQLYETYRPKLSLGTLQKGLVLDMPLTSKRYNVGNSKFDDLTPYENRGVNNGGDVDTDHTTFIAANSDNVRIPDSESLSPTSAMTAMVCVKGESQNNYIFTHYDSSVNQRSFAFRNLNLSNKVSIYVSEDGQSGSGHFKNYQSSIVVFDNTWHLIGFTFDAGTLKLFVDGVEDTNPTKTNDDAITTIHDSTADVMVGCFLENNNPANFFNGDISGAKIWNRALSGREMLLSFEKQKGAFL